MRTAFQGAVAQMLLVYDLILLLKVARDGACLTSSSRLFQLRFGNVENLAVFIVFVYSRDTVFKMCRLEFCFQNLPFSQPAGQKFAVFV